MHRQKRVFKKDSHVIKQPYIVHLPLVTRYNGTAADCKQGLQWPPELVWVVNVHVSSVFRSVSVCSGVFCVLYQVIQCAKYGL